MRKELVTVGRGLTVLRDGRGMPEWQAPVLQPDGSRTFAWSKYPQPVMVAWTAALEVTGHDFEYLEHIEAVRRMPIASACSTDLATWFTYLFRGERFSDGHIAGFIRSGELQAMLERLLELSASAGSAGSNGSSGS